MLKTAAYALDSWLVTNLALDATVAAFVGERYGSEEVEPGTGFPYLVWREVAVQSRGRLGRRRNARTLLDREIRVVASFPTGLGSWEPLEEVADRIEEVVNLRPSPSLEGFVVAGSMLLRPVRRIESLGEERLYHAGALFRFYVDRAV